MGLEMSDHDGALGRPRAGAPAPADLARSVAAAFHPDRNEDAHLLDVGARVAAVFDGMGGHAAGEIASGIGRGVAEAHLGSAARWGRDWPQRVLLAGRRELLRARRRDGSEMSTTAVVAIVTESELSVAWCGDSRAYAVYHDGGIQLLTRDHNGVDAERRRGRLSETAAADLQQVLDDVSDAREARTRGGRDAEIAYSARNLVSSSLDRGPIDTAIVPAASVVAVMLTSDGVHDNLTRAELGAAVRRGLSRRGTAGIAAAVVAAAQRRAGEGTGRAKPDDITAVVLPVGSR